VEWALTRRTGRLANADGFPARQAAVDVVRDLVSAEMAIRVFG